MEISSLMCTNMSPYVVCYSTKIYALQAEALLKLNRHQEADEALSRGPNFEVDACSKFFGPIGNANLLAIRAQVDMVAGRYCVLYSKSTYIYHCT